MSSGYLKCHQVNKIEKNRDINVDFLHAHAFISLPLSVRGSILDARFWSLNFDPRTERVKYS